MGSINAIPEFKSYYNLGEKGAASTGLVFSIFQIGQMVGALFIWISDWRGRRLAIFVGCVGVVLSTILTSLAPNRKSETFESEQDISNTPKSERSLVADSC
jgi:MFS family permease